jgi:hypothetical protein
MYRITSIRVPCTGFLPCSYIEGMEMEGRQREHDPASNPSVSGFKKEGKRRRSKRERLKAHLFSFVSCFSLSFCFPPLAVAASSSYPPSSPFSAAAASSPASSAHSEIKPISLLRLETMGGGMAEWQMSGKTPVRHTGNRFLRFMVQYCALQIDLLSSCSRGAPAWDREKALFS